MPPWSAQRECREHPRLQMLIGSCFLSFCSCYDRRFMLASPVGPGRRPGGEGARGEGLHPPARGLPPASPSPRASRRRARSCGFEPFGGVSKEHLRAKIRALAHHRPQRQAEPAGDGHDRRRGPFARPQPPVQLAHHRVATHQLPARLDERRAKPGVARPHQPRLARALPAVVRPRHQAGVAGKLLRVLEAIPVAHLELQGHRRRLSPMPGTLRSCAMRSR